MERILRLALTLLLIVPVTAHAQDSANAIASEAVFFSNQPAMTVMALLTVSRGREGKTRDLRLDFISEGDSDKLLVRVTAPAFLRNLKVLMVAKDGSSRTWIKTSQGTRRLSSGSRGEALFQSDFLSSDFIIPDGGWRFPTDKFEEGLLVLERDGSSAEGFASQRLFLRESDKVIVRREFLDKSGTATRSYAVSAWSDVGGSSVPSKIELTLAGVSNQSLMEVSSIDTAPAFPKGLFLPGGL